MLKLTPTGGKRGETRCPQCKSDYAHIVKYRYPAPMRRPGDDTNGINRPGLATVARGYLARPEGKAPNAHKMLTPRARINVGGPRPDPTRALSLGLYHPVEIFPITAMDAATAPRNAHQNPVATTHSRNNVRRITASRALLSTIPDLVANVSHDSSSFGAVATVWLKPHPKASMSRLSPLPLTTPVIGDQFTFTFTAVLAERQVHASMT